MKIALFVVSAVFLMVFAVGDFCFPYSLQYIQAVVEAYDPPPSPPGNPDPPPPLPPDPFRKA